MDRDVLKVYMILAGRTSLERTVRSRKETVNCMEGLDWKQVIFKRGKYSSNSRYTTPFFHETILWFLSCLFYREKSWCLVIFWCWSNIKNDEHMGLFRVKMKSPRFSVSRPPFVVDAWRRIAGRCVREISERSGRWTGIQLRRTFLWRGRGIFEKLEYWFF